MRRPLATLVGAGLLALLVGCAQQPTSAPAPAPTRSTSRSTSPATPPATPPSTPPTSPPSSPVTGPAVATSKDRYLALAGSLHARSVEVWFEADLVKAWLAGPTAFRTAVARLGALARGTRVSGFKIADEIGYDDGLTSAAQATAFLRAARTALAAAAPGVPVLVDAVVLELGCQPWRGPAAQVSCASSARREHPAASIAAVTSYLEAGLVDRLDLSTGLLEPATYARWGLTRTAAQRAAWRFVVSAGWGSMTRLQSRKALAAPGGYAGSPAQTAADLDTYVDVPRVTGARAVDVWTWRQPYSGSTVSLLDGALRPNRLWTGLRQRHDAGAELFTHMTPSAMPIDAAGIARECAVVAQVFSAVFVAAGTG